MPSYVARPHVLADEFVPGYLGDSFGLFPFVHGDPLANQFDGPFLVRLIRKEVTHISGFPFGIESRDPDIPSCWHSGTMRRSCCWSIPCHNQANPLPTNDTPASDIPQRFQCPAMLGDGGVGMGQKEMATTAAGKNRDHDLRPESRWHSSQTLTSALCPLSSRRLKSRCHNRGSKGGGDAGARPPKRETFEPQLAGRAAALPALSRIASAQAYPTQSAVVGSKRVVDGLNVPGSIPVLPCVHKRHRASSAWMLQDRPASTPAHA